MYKLCGTCVYICIDKYVYVCIYMYVYIHIHAHANGYTLSTSPLLSLSFT